MCCGLGRWTHRRSDFRDFPNHPGGTKEKNPVQLEKATPKTHHGKGRFLKGAQDTALEQSGTMECSCGLPGKVFLRGSKLEAGLQL